MRTAETVLNVIRDRTSINCTMYLRAMVAY